MLKSFINTWACDNCATEVVSEFNPNFRFVLQLQKLDSCPTLAIDLCKTCCGLVSIPAIQTFTDENTEPVS